MSLSRPHSTIPTSSASPGNFVPVDASLKSWRLGQVQTSVAYAIRVGALSLLLLIEILWLTIRFDTQTISAAAGDWGRLFQLAPYLSQFAIVMGAAFCLVGTARLRIHWQEFESASQYRSSWRWWGLAQVTLYLLLLSASHWLYEGNALTSKRATLAALLWLNLAFGTALAWMGAVAPMRCWLRSLRAEAACLLLGGAIGGASLFLMHSSRALWEPLSDVTLAVVYAILNCCFSDVIVDGSTRLIGTSSFYVEIAPQCSGYEGIGLVSAFLTAFFLMFRQRLRFPQAWLLWPLGIVTIWFCNALRIALLIMIGSVLSPAVAMGGFHSQAGWIFFNVVSLALAAAALRLPFFARESAGTESDSQTSPVTRYLAPFLCLMAFNLLFGAFTTSFDWGYPLKMLATVLAWGVLVPPAFSRMRFALPTGNQVRRAAIDRLPAVGIGTAVFCLWVLMIGFQTEQLHPPMPVELQDAPRALMIFWLVARVIGSVIIVPIVEELAFRGYLMRRFISVQFDSVRYDSVSWWAVLASSALFGLMHQHWMAGIMAGLAYAWAASRKNSLADAIIAHAVTNGLIAVTVLTLSAWWLW